MNQFGCTKASRFTAWPCTALIGSGGEQVTMLTPPVSFWDGTTVPVYVFDHGQYCEVTDDAGVLAHLQISGFAIADDKRKQIGLRKALERHGVALEDEMRLFCKKDELQGALRRYLAALFEVKHWQYESTGKIPDPAALLSEAELYLTALKPGAVVKRNVSALGITGKPLTFPLQLDDTLYDSSKPSSSAHVLKKLLDVRSVPANADLLITVVMDDRRDKDKARDDMQIFSQLAHVLRFTELKERGMAAMTMT